MSTTLEIYTLPLPEQQRATVEKLSVLMANDGRKRQNPERLPFASQQEARGDSNPRPLPCHV
jgi:hypothetical protein